MTAIAFLPDRNQRGHDYTGAFLPCAIKWCAHFGGARFPISLDQTRRAQRATMLATIGVVPPRSDARFSRSTIRVAATITPTVEPLRVAFFCHGFRSRIGLGWDTTTAHQLAAALASAAAGRPVIVSLYACSTGDGPGPGGDGGFADFLRDKLCQAGATSCVVMGHDVPGHAGRNSRKRRFAGEGSSVGGTGGAWWVAPGAPLWRRWREAMRTGDLWIRVPEMTAAEVHAELAREATR